MVVLLVGIFAFRLGEMPEKIFVSMIAVSDLIEIVNRAIFGRRGFEDFDASRLLLDLLMLLVCVWLLIRANRIWTVFAAAAQLVVVIGSLAVLVPQQGMQLAYWAMTQAPLWLQIGILVTGIAAHRERVKRLGPYRSWRTINSEKN